MYKNFDTNFFIETIKISWPKYLIITTRKCRQIKFLFFSHLWCVKQYQRGWYHQPYLPKTKLWSISGLETRYQSMFFSIGNVQYITVLTQHKCLLKICILHLRHGSIKISKYMSYIYSSCDPQIPRYSILARLGTLWCYICDVKP